MNAPPGEVTRLLSSIRQGDEGAGHALFDLVYGDLHARAGALFLREQNAHTLQTTALVHEAWMKLGGQELDCVDRQHFFTLAVKVMRQVLLDHARKRSRLKRGAGQRPVTIDESHVFMDSAVDVIALDDSLRALERLNERHAQVVELRVFGGLTIAETAAILGVSHTTVENDWAMAATWLRAKLTA